MSNRYERTFTVRNVDILMVSESFLPQVNGVTNSVRRALEHLQSEGHRAMLVAPSGPDEYAGAAVHRVRTVAMPTYPEFPVGLATRGHLRRLMTSFAPDVVHLASPAWLGHQAGEAARSLGIPVVAVYQTDLIGFAERYPFPGAAAAMRGLTRRVHGPADRTLVPSTASGEQLAALGIERIHRWGRGVDTELFTPARRSEDVRRELGDGVLLGYVGRLAAEKELELLAHLNDVPGTRLVLVGGGPEEQRLRTLLPGAAFLGVRHGEDLAAVVASLDVFVHTGRTETFCQSAQEALASGVPVVAPRAGGPVDLVGDDVNGLLYTPGDGAELRRQVSRLVEQDPLRRAMGERAVAGVRDRSWHAVNEQLLDHYRAVCPAPAKARTGRPRISVIGTGYLGATHAAGMAELGFEVVGVDQDPDKVAALAEGRLPFHEPDLPELLHRHVTSGRLRFTTSLREAADFADVHFVCVGTPQGPSGAAEMTHVRNAVEALVPLLQRPSLLVGKSTVPVGTAESLVRSIEELAPPGVDVGLAWNPEFLREGHAVHDTLHPDRIVLGTLDPAGDPAAERTLREVYAAPIAAGTPVVVTDLPTAELVKVSANAFLATKISFINAMAELCEATGADVTLLSEALGHDERIGRRFLASGLGFGGGCLPKDIRALVARADELGRPESVDFLRSVDRINQRRRDRVVEMAAAQVGFFPGARIAVLGAAFKPDSDDVRDSPALDVARRLEEAGAHITVYDPAANLTARAVAPRLRFAANAATACRKADLVLHLTEWAEFGELDPAALGAVVRRKVVIDARNALDVAKWQAAGWVVQAPGRHISRPATVPDPVSVVDSLQR